MSELCTYCKSTVTDMQRVVNIQWTLLWISVGILRSSCRGSECFVKPTVISTCPGEPCYTLSEYTSREAVRYFGSKVTVWFLSGTHALNQSLIISNVDNFMLIGVYSSSIPQIACETNTFSGLLFTNVSVLTIKNIGIVNCSGSHVQGELFASIHFYIVTNLTVTDVLIRNCSLYGLRLHNLLGNSIISSATFSNNSGGHIYIVFERKVSTYSEKNHITVRDTVFELGNSPLTIFIDTDHVGIDIINITTQGCIPKHTADIDLFMKPWTLSSIEVNIKESEIAFSAGAAISIILPDVIAPSSLPSDTVTVRIISCNIQRNHQGGIIIGVQPIQPAASDDSYYSMLPFSIRITDSLIANNGFFTHSQGSGLAIMFPRDIYSGNIACRIDIDNVHFTQNNYAPILPRTKLYSPTEYMATVFLAYVHNVTFSNSSFVESNGTAICAYQSSFHVFHKISFINNTAYQGGAMGFYGNSSLIVHKNAHLVFINNHAKNVGGAIFVEEKLSLSAFQFLETSTNHYCFVCFPDKTAVSDINIQFSFLNNTALRGGDAIFGEVFETCIIGTASESLDVFTFILLYSEFEPNVTHTPSVISSNPVHVCFCENGMPLHTALLINETRYPGESFNISAVLVGSLFGSLCGPIYATFMVLDDSKEVPQLGELQQIQQSERICRELTYTVLSSNRVELLALTTTSASVVKYPDTDILNTLIEQNGHNYLETKLIQYIPVYINITLRSCPLGFKLSNHPSQCICDIHLQKHNFTCTISDQTVFRKGTVWINASFIGTSYKGVLIHFHCPYGYCKQEGVHVNLEAPHLQCAMNRSGILCGRCNIGLSLAIGTSHCILCSSKSLAVLVIFAVAGIALVVLLKVLNLTISQGTINGLLFYVNIVGANQAVLFPMGRTNVLTVFIAWLNLDFGIQTCFFNGLNGYWKMWLQFLFPVYVWSITAFIIIVSHYYSFAARLFGRNSVPVLATLLLMSCAKLLRTIISVCSFAVLTLPNGSTSVVWLLDGNIKFLGSAHIPLFLTSLVFLLFLWLPYTVILVSMQCLQKYSYLKVIRCIVKLKPFFDAHFGHLKDKHRYWVGALLLIRGILFLVFAANPTNAPSVNLLAIALSSIILLMYIANNGHVYTMRYFSFLENSFFFNLAILSSASLYIQASATVHCQEILTNASVSIVFVQFIGVVLFHSWVLLKNTTVWRTLKTKLHHPAVAQAECPQNSDSLEYHRLNEIQPVNLRVRFNELGEPTLEQQ